MVVVARHACQRAAAKVPGGAAPHDRAANGEITPAIAVGVPLVGRRERGQFLPAANRWLPSGPREWLQLFIGR